MEITKKGLQEYLADDLASVKSLIEKDLESDISLLNATNRSLLSHSGKFIRPILSLLVSKACSTSDTTEDSIRFAAASELLHNATLLHDDVADDSSSRRGFPTVMSLLGSRASVLLGDFWLVKAVGEILNADNHKDYVIRIFSSTLSDLAEGEMLQLEKASSCDTTEDDYYRIIFNKTASLFQTTAMAAASSVNASEEMTQAVKQYAYNVGIAFQIKDDILDYKGDASIGKPVGQDLKEHKITLPLLGAFRNAGIDREQEIRQKLLAIDEHPEYNDEILSFVLDNGGIEYAEMKLEEHCRAAEDSLSVLPGSPAVDYLGLLARFVIDRDK